MSDTVVTWKRQSCTAFLDLHWRFRIAWCDMSVRRRLELLQRRSALRSFKITLMMERCAFCFCVALSVPSVKFGVFKGTSSQRNWNQPLFSPVFCRLRLYGVLMCWIPDFCLAVVYKQDWKSYNAELEWFLMAIPSPNDSSIQRGLLDLLLP